MDVKSTSIVFCDSSNLVDEIWNAKLLRSLDVKIEGLEYKNKLQSGKSNFLD